MKRHSIIWIALLLPTVSIADTLNIDLAFQKALHYDSKYLSAEASSLAQREEIEMAKAGFLPKIGISATLGRGVQDRTTNTANDRFLYNNKNYSLTLKQPIFNWSNISTYRQAIAASAQGESIALNEKGNLYVRVAAAYLNILYAKDNLEYSLSFKEAALGQLKSAEMKFKKGQGTITEVNEALATHEKSVAYELNASKSLDLNSYDLQMLIGESPTNVARLNPTKIQKQHLSGADLDKWISQAEHNNQEIQSAREEVFAAEQEIEKRIAGHYPTLDLVASRTQSENDSNFTIGSGTTYDSTNIAMQLNMPLYSGGYVNSSIKQANAKLEEAKNKLDGATRKVKADVRKYFNAFTSGVAQLQALEQVLISTEISYTGVRKGFEFGTRSNVDVLNAQEKLFKSRVELSQARYQFINDLVSLYAISGKVDSFEMLEVNSWFDTSINAD